ncbi:hypothetical protein [Phreatobacter stygius]|uniref:hypothetical protein n=1 Tax=Phreatobacter stygius TaxID=1940610 RepID=UPI001476F4E4|nr:hypothetical protein [Phreatobacter stygius]
MFALSDVERLAKKIFLRECLTNVTWSELSEVAREAYRAEARRILYRERQFAA